LSGPVEWPVAAGGRVVAIHQPNFLPWLGYFDKLARADTFVLLDSVQFPKRNGTWMNRVKLLVGGEPGWITVPIVRAYHGLGGASSWRRSSRAIDAPHISTKRCRL